MVDDPSRLPRAKHLARVNATCRGFVTAIHCEQVGVAEHGSWWWAREERRFRGPRRRAWCSRKRLVIAVQAGETLCTVHYNLDTRLVQAMRLLSESFEIGDQAPPPVPLVRKIIGAGEIS